jgi:transcriptional regulator with XRE-family HTH domain
MNEDFPERLRKIRVLKNYSQEFVAEQIGVSVSSYARYELGKVDIDFYSVARLAKLYKISIDTLFRFGDPGYTLEEMNMEYQAKDSVTVIVELDGSEATFTHWIKKLTAINGVL